MEDKKETRYFVKIMGLNNEQIGLAGCYTTLDNALDYVYDALETRDYVKVSIEKIIVNPFNIDNELKAFEKKKRSLKKC